MDDQLYAKVNAVIRHLDDARDAAHSTNVYDVDEYLKMASALLDHLRDGVAKMVEGLDDTAPFGADVDEDTVRSLARLVDPSRNVADDARVQFTSDGATVWATDGEEIPVDGDDLGTFIRTNAEMAERFAPDGCPTGG